MKLFDLHADTGFAVMQGRGKGERDIITTQQLPKRKKGGFSWVCMASYFEGSESWEAMQAMINALHEDIASCPEVQLVKTKEDLYANVPLHAICSVEGMCGIQTEPEAKIDWLYEHDIKIASLAWNDENALATGVRGNPNRGLSELGIRAVKQMNQHQMIIDVSHANEQTFWDLMEVCETGIIATHSNARTLCDHPRNLWDEQLLEIVKHDGLIGVVCAGAFVHKEKQQRDIAHLVAHMKYLKQLIGIDHIALGLDFMDDYEGGLDTMLMDLNEPSQAQGIIKTMSNEGFTNDEIQKIAYGNALRYLNQYL